MWIWLSSNQLESELSGVGDEAQIRLNNNQSESESEFDSVYEAMRDSMWVVNHILIRKHNCKIKGIFIISCSEFWYITFSGI